MRLLFIVNDAGFVLSHWRAAIERHRAEGIEVEIASPEGPSAERLRQEGWTVHPIPLRRHSRNPVREVLLVLAFWRLIRRVRPDIAHLVTIKPVLWGGLVCRALGVRRVGYISGLGYAMLAPGRGGVFLRLLMRGLFPFALGGRRGRVVVENSDDRATLADMGVTLEGRCHAVAGAGVDLVRFRPAPEPPGPVTVLMPARLLRDKGAAEFVAAARLLAARGIEVRFRHAGALDADYPNSVEPETLAAWRTEGAVEFLGKRSDMPDVLAAAHIVCLPSYREGLPLALAEAAATGRAIVATDVPGCREAVVDGETGLLVPSRDPEALADAIATLAADDDLRVRMGQAGRRLAEARFGIDAIAGQLRAVYEELLAEP